MKVSIGSIIVAILLATLAAGPLAFILIMALASAQGMLGEVGVDAGVVLVVLLFEVFGASLAILPSAILALGLGILGQGSGVARSFPTWVAAGVLGGAAVAFYLEAPSKEHWLVIGLTGAGCGLLERACLRWRPA